MIIAIISDIHANIEALEQVIDDIQKQEVDKIICLGDIVGYGPNPNECIEKLKNLGCLCLAGNHDWAALGMLDTSTFNRVAKHAIDWTKEQLTPNNLGFLQGLPLTQVEEGCLFVHATPQNPEKWGYIIAIGHARQAFQEFHEKVCFVGHTHYPFVLQQKNEEIYNVTKAEVEFEEDCRYLINVGSVGQPRDKNPDASYGIIDTEKNTFRFRRIPYPIQAVKEKIIQAGLDMILGTRLEKGT